MIEFKSVSKKYRTSDRTVVVLEDAGFNIAKGDFIGLVGRSGTGKTTVLNLLGGLDRPDSGSVVFEGVALEKLSDRELARFRNQTIGFVFQHFFLRRQRTALDNVMVPLLFGEHSISDARRLGREALVRVGLEKQINAKASDLSGGQRQRVSIARAIASKPRLLLADEPTGSLDAETSHEILRILVDLRENMGTTVVVVTHDPLVKQLGPVLYTVTDGKVRPLGAEESVG